jgi:prolipoprotein diacylglyceryltransferase
VIYFLSFYYLEIWLFLRNTAEIIANSWKEWVIGKVRIINHGFYAGLGTALSLFTGSLLAGRNYALALMAACITLIICSALWAQIIEGSPKLKRPFGYYGAVFGLILAGGIIWLFRLNTWVALAAVSVSMPWGQAVGRLRCLVNGCCHGSRTESLTLGIRFNHPRSRVHNISGLQGELIHPTQLYSIVWLFFIGIVLFTLWVNHCSNTLILGLYLILTSTGRFVEEAFRGEAQTPVIRGLRLYQWVAIIVVLAGIGITMIRVEPVTVNPGLGWETILYSAIGGLFAMFAMGVDFPYSNARFSRLV